MKISLSLAEAFNKPCFEKQLADFLAGQGYLEPSASGAGEGLGSSRFLSRSILPHIQRLSATFNRLEGEAPLRAYWKKTCNLQNLRLGYFLYFMPCNAMRVAAVWQELGRLGFRFPRSSHFSALDLGCGSGAGATGIYLAEKDLGLIPTPARHRWAFLEKDKANLKLARSWVPEFQRYLGFCPPAEIRGFHRPVPFSARTQGILPPGAGRFDLWVFSMVLNEVLPDDHAKLRLLATRLLESWDRHLNEEGLVLIVEPALRTQSRKLLMLRRELIRQLSEPSVEQRSEPSVEQRSEPKGEQKSERPIKQSPARRLGHFKVLLPCLGAQACGALAVESDWCHEEITWWRPPYLRKIDSMAGLDHRSLAFSYLVLCKSARPIEEILPALQNTKARGRYRLVSPGFAAGRDTEFFLCGQEGKSKNQMRNAPPELGRGSVFLDAQIEKKNKSAIGRVVDPGGII